MTPMTATARTARGTQKAQKEQRPEKAREARKARKARKTTRPGRYGPGLLVPAGLAAVLLLLAVAGPWLAPQDPAAGSLDDRLLGLWTPGHPLGTDTQGRDMLSRLIVAVRPSLIGGLLPVAVAAVAGTLLGAVAGLAGRVTEQVLLRTLDVLYAFPGVLLAIAVASLLEPGLSTTVISLSFVLTPAVARVSFTEVRRIRTAEYLEAALVSGAGRTAVVLRQVAPVVAPVVLVYCSSLVGLAIVYAAGLSFLGLGVAPPDPEWGAMLDESRPALLTHPAVAVLPAVTILAVSVVFNTLGDALRARTGDSRALRPEAVR
ncbi:ABC transporter permease [Streptomyces sp. NPDC050804]|uniref:ABC transporter permease n=1 Tax=Streptomyces sp. NPDC050804 TaxID=3154745 RepID=UPI00342A2366